MGESSGMEACFERAQHEQAQQQQAQGTQHRGQKSRICLPVVVETAYPVGPRGLGSATPTLSGAPIFPT